MKLTAVRDLVGAVLLLACGTALPALASESATELAIGGLTFTPSADLSIEAEDLTITPEFVTVKYRLLNASANPVTVTMSFPLPEIDLGDADANYAFPANDPVNFVAFQTKVDGKPVKFDVQQRAYLASKDVTAAVRAAGLALLPIGQQSTAIAGLVPPTRDKLINDGLLVQAGANENGEPIYHGTWVVKTSASRKQVFPPGKPVAIEHRYRTSLGISLDSVLRRSVRQQKAMEPEVQRYTAAYCVQDELLKGVDKLAGAADPNTAKVQERRMTYQLVGGAEPPMMIKDFRLVIDKGRADRLVSFCGENVKKISPTAFELRAKDFTPAQDIKVLLVSRAEVTEAKKLPRVDAPVPQSVTRPEAPPQ
jgi:hypothetical protein